MSVSIDALYIFDDHRNPVLEHIYTGRPPTAQVLIASYTSRPSPRPAVLQLSDVAPPVTAYSISHSSLLVIAVAAKDAQSLAVLDFLHPLVDIFEDFLGSPLLATRLEESYEIVAQILGEVCDGGIICNTEPNALRESVEVSSGLGKFLTHVGLPGSSQALAPSSNFGSSLRAGPTQASGPAIPWRKSNVRHTSNELYVDIVETLSVIFAPSGRPISARAHGSIAFTAKISGVPDLLLSLSAPGGTSNAKSAGIARTMQIPVFHPCVRLARWKEHPGELSFIPPDGRFMLAGYETDLMPSSLNSDEPPSKTDRLFLPANVDLRTGTGNSSSDFEARLTLNNNFPGIASSTKPNTTRTGSGPIGSLSFGNNSGSSSAPSLEAIIVTIPFPANVRNVTELRASRGEATFNAFDKVVEWKVSTKDGASVNGVATLTGSVVGPLNADSVVDDELQAAEVGKSNSIAGYYNEDNVANETEQYGSMTNGSNIVNRKVQASKALMPRSISVSFNVKGWLPSGVKVDSLVVDVKKSKGLGDGVKPYKGVKYLTVSRQGVERRIE